MSLKAGIVGLPNVGKSTLFNAITKQNILAANYPFATIEPNVGIVFVPDKRVDYLASMYKPKSVVPTTFEFTDIAGLVSGASRGEGLGNKFLSHIRECDAICEVVRCFNDPNVTHVTGKVDPISDIEVINIELVLADLDVINNRIDKIEKKGVIICYITLHVGLGTFRPVNVEDVTKHKMHSEFYSMSKNSAKILSDAKKDKRNIISVGTTTTRTLETIMSKYGEFRECSGWTDIFIYPGYEFKGIDGLITNFHLPKSTLVMLVSAFASKEIILNAYKHAVEEKYRFFSFGDAMFIKKNVK